MRKPDSSFMFIFIMKIKKIIVEDAKLANNAPFSAPPRALREILNWFLFKFVILGND
jgi:hypothetical protein